MKRTLFYMLVGIMILLMVLSSCVNDKSNHNLQSNISEPKVNTSLENKSNVNLESEPNTIIEDESNTSLQIRIQTDSFTIVAALNDSSAAKSFYDQLPITLPAENYSTNEKIFYPPQKLDVSDTPLAKGSIGTLAYYEPWGDIVIFYGDYHSSSGLYQLGEVVFGIEQLESLSGEIKIEKMTD